MKRTVWITGVAGFTGWHLVSFLRRLPEPLEIIGLDCRPVPNGQLDAFYVMDLTAPDALHKLARQHPPDRVFHLAGLLPPAPEAEMWRVNVGGTQRLLQVLGAANIKHLRILSIGSAAEYCTSSSKLKETDPCGGKTPYGRTKWAQSVIALACGRQLGLDLIIARGFNLLGPGLPPTLVAGSLCAQLAGNGAETIKVGNLHPRRDFVDVRDAVKAYWLICDRGRPGQIYNVCSGRATSIQTLVQLFLKFTDKRVRIETDPTRSRRRDPDRVRGNNDRLLRLGWKPSISLRRSVQDMLNYARS